MSISSDIRKKQNDISTLEKQKNDLTDDRGDISTINRLITDLQYSFQHFLTSDYTAGIINKIETLVEPYQSNDINIQNSCSYINTEISALQKEIYALEEAKRATERAKAAINGVGNTF